MTTGHMLLYIGIGGMAAVAVAAVIVICVMTTSRKRLRKKLDEEYGKVE